LKKKSAAVEFESEYPFVVHVSNAIAKKLVALHKQADEQGRRQETLAAIRGIADQLHNDPFEFGEPLYRLQSLELEVRHGGVYPLFVDYAVHQKDRQVFIKGVYLLPPKRDR
jgi:hypothetical protein